MLSRSRLGGLLAAVSVLTLTTSSLTAAAPASATVTPKPARVAAQPRTVTLISGDRLTVYADGKLAQHPRPGARLMIYKNRQQLYAIPVDALALLRAGRIDLRLFDVTRLLEAGHDKRAELPLIVTGSATTAAPSTLAVTRRLPLIRGYAGKVKQGDTSAYWTALKSGGTGKVWLDGLRKPSLDVSVPQIGAPAAWAAGWDGTGVKVAVLDTGIDPDHPDLAGKILAEKNFGGEYEDELDYVGHGTHVASTIAGSGAASGGKYKGVAPGASLLDGKVCVEYGCLDSWILDGMQWAADNGAQVVNMSLGGFDDPGLDPIEQAVNDLSASHGILFVIAAGNSGPGDQTLSSPASADAALAVGAVDKQDGLAEFSSRGPRVGDTALKPEITGPGVDIVAARSKDGFLGKPGDSYMPLSGTSMATPHVAGAAALLTQQHPQWTAQQRKAALMASAQPNATDGPFAQGAGRVDAGRAVKQAITTTPAAISLGVQSWPHDDDVPDQRTVTYHNPGASDVTLQLGFDGVPAPGIFSLSASSLTVPAGGSATVTLTSDTREGGKTLGLIGGRIVATAGDIRVFTPFAVDREVEKFAIDLVHTGRDGAPNSTYFTVVIDLSTYRDNTVFYGEPTVRLRLPHGDYMVFSWIEDGNQVSQLMRARLTIDGDRAIPLDARLAKGFDVTVPEEKAVPVSANIIGSYSGISVILGMQSFGDLFSAYLDPKPIEGFFAEVMGVFVLPGPDPGGPVLDSPSVTHVVDHRWGSFYTGHSLHPKWTDLAHIQPSYYAHAGERGVRTLLAEIPDAPMGLGIGLVFTLPLSRSEYITTGNPWSSRFQELTVDEDGNTQTLAASIERAREFQPGKVYPERWNRAPYTVAYYDTPDYPDMGHDKYGIYAFPNLASDADGRAGWTIAYEKARTALYRNGELVEEFDSDIGHWEVAPEKARYRLESTVERAKPFVLSTHVSVVWEFDSVQPPGDEVTTLPIAAFGFLPSLDAKHSSPRRAPMFVPLAVRLQDKTSSLRKVTVEISADDGKTWRKVPVVNLLGHRFVVYANPGKAGFVSYRASSEDTRGNTSVQTVIRAYQVK